MNTEYEWDVEMVDNYGEIVDHYFCSSYCEALQYVRATSEVGTRLDIVLVRDGRHCSGRSWAYVHNGKLPEYFYDAYNFPTHHVPVSFHKEIEKSIDKV